MKAHGILNWTGSSTCGYGDCSLPCTNIGVAAVTAVGCRRKRTHISVILVCQTISRGVWEALLVPFSPLLLFHSSFQDRRLLQAAGAKTQGCSALTASSPELPKLHRCQKAISYFSTLHDLGVWRIVTCHTCQNLNSRNAQSRVFGLCLDCSTSLDTVATHHTIANFANFIWSWKLLNMVVDSQCAKEKCPNFSYHGIQVVIHYVHCCGRSSRHWEVSHVCQLVCPILTVEEGQLLLRHFSRCLQWSMHLQDSTNNGQYSARAVWCSTIMYWLLLNTNR